MICLLELGTTVGLVLAHGFASWLSTSIIGEASDQVAPWDVLQVQLGAAFAIAALGIAAVIVAPASIELMAARVAVAAAIAAQVFLESRTRNSALRAVVYGFLALLAGVTVAAVKSFLVH